MKKLYGVALIFVALLSCVFFSACGNKYKNLKMSFVDSDGKAITQVNLILDTEKEDAPSSMELSVKFSGIKSKEVGDVSVTNQQGLVSIVEKSFSKGKYTFTINAMQSGVGELKVTHLASSKTKTIDLVVDKKSHDLTPLNKKYIYSIPETGTKTVVLSNNLVSLSPIDSTDKVYYDFVETPSVDGLTFNRQELTDGLNQGSKTVITSLTISSQVDDNTEIQVYPITYLDGYSNTSYESKPPITIVFKRILTNENVVLTSDEKHQPYLDSNQPIYLIAKDSGVAGQENGRYEYAYLNAELKYKIGTLNQSLFDADFMNFYSYSASVEAELSSDKNNIAVNQMQNSIQIYALDFTTNVVTVKIELVPNTKNYAGEIYKITKTLRVKGELKPTGIEVNMAGKPLTLNNPDVCYDLFDYYVANSNGFISEKGFLFNFEPVLPDSFADLKGVQLTVDDQTLNSLDICVYNEPMKFDSYGTNNNKSEILTGLQLKNVYMKVKSNVQQDENTTFSVSLSTVSVSNLSYLEGIEGAGPFVMYFKHAQGVDSITLNAGQITREGTSFNLINDGNNNIEVENVFLDVNEGVNVLKEHGAYMLYMAGTGTIGGADRGEVRYAKFTVSVVNNFNAAHPLLIKQYSQTDGNGTGTIEGASTEILYEYNAQTGINNSIMLVVYSGNGEDENFETNTGNYTIVFQHENGYRKEINCLVYKSITENDIKLSNNINTKGNLAFENVDFVSYGYDANYIVAAGQNLNFRIDDSNIDANLKPKYSYPASVEQEADNVEGYVSLTPNLNNVNIRFNKGSFIGGEIRNIIVEFTVTVDNYANILTKSAQGKSYGVEKSFFVFELIKYDFASSGNNIVLTDNSGKTNNFSIQRYPNGLLGCYFNGEIPTGEDLSRVDLRLALNDNNLWNYVLTMPQTNLNVGSLTEGKVVWSTEAEVTLSTLSQTDVTEEMPAATLSVQVLGQQVSYPAIVLTGTITQFKIVIPIRYTIYVSEPIISETVAVNSSYNINVAEQRPYININEGQEYVLTATISSSKGEVTISKDELASKENQISLVVVSDFGNVVSGVVEGNKILLNSGIEYSHLKVYVFALDALKQRLGNAAISNPSDLLMDGHKRAYFELDIIVSNGTKENPFLIVTAEDFWNLNQNNNLEDEHNYYTLMNNININTQKHIGMSINEFDGHISTYSNHIFTLYGIALDNNSKNLFKDFSGTIENVNFSVSYNYNLTVVGTELLGLIDVNNGTLTNVTLNISGQNTLNDSGSSEVYFGCLVAENNGTINYTSNSIIGVNGGLTLNGSSTTYFGSFAGVNHGTIEGYSSENEIDKTLITKLSMYEYKPIASPEIVFTVLLNNSGAFADVEIVSNLTNLNSAVGGVVGLNQPKEGVDLKFANGYVAGKITATNNNVGGFIGKNVINASQQIQVELVGGHLSDVKIVGEGFKAYNLKSAMIIDANENAGGIVGYDEHGYYYNCHYQVFEENSLVGTNNVGGIAGYSMFGVFNYCSVMSYRWVYNKLDSTFADSNPDIVGENYVGGLVGLTVSNVETLSAGNYNDATTLNRNLTAILHSSVNAYISAESQLGALFASERNTTIVFNAYFVGKLSEADLPQMENGNLNISNNDAGLIFGNYYYTVNETEQAVYFQQIGSETFGLNATNLIGWLQNDSINGGYVYLTLDGVNPLFETSVDFVVEVKEDRWLTDTDSNTIKNLLHLQYYNFLIDKLDTNNRQLLSELTERYNTYDILDLLNVTPTTETTQAEIRVGVTSSDPNIVRVQGNKIIILATGSCKLNFFSAFNKELNFEINVIVTTPVGEYALQESESSPTITNLTTLKIAKNTSKQLYAKSVGEIVYNEVAYQYTTTTSLHKDVVVSCVGGTLEGSVANYISISGKTLDGDGKVELNADAILAVKVLDYLENGRFNISVNPYQMIEFKQGDVLHKIKLPFDNISFNVETYQGPTDLHLNYHSAVLCPNNSLEVNAIVETDLELTENEAQNLVESVQFRKLTENDFADVENKDAYYTYLGAEKYDAASQTQTVKYKITFKNLQDIQEEQIMRIWFSVKDEIGQKYDGVPERYVDVVVCPELIDELDVKNYTYKVDDNYDIVYDNNGKPTIEENDILRPTGQGLIIINVTPKNGFYNYLEIKDITGNEEIKFTQLDGVLGHTMTELDEQTADGLGIKIKRYDNVDGFNKSTLYISTHISELYSNKIHTLQITAFDLEDNQICSKIISINVKMTPSVSVQYRDPNGILYNAKEYVDNSLYLAYGVPAELLIQPINSDGEVNISQNLPSGVSVDAVRDNLYTITMTGEKSSLLGQELIISANTYVTINGRREYCEDVTIKFKIVEFVVHNVSVANSRVNYGTSERDTIRYFDGVVNKPTKIEFLLENSTRTKDISYLDNGEYLKKTYRVSDSEKADSTGALRAIYDILDELNTKTLQYVTLGQMQDGNFVGGGVSSSVATLDSNGLTVKDAFAKDLAIQIHFYLALENDVWKVQIDKSLTDCVEFSYIYLLNFTSSTSFIKPEVIKNEEDFLNMSSNGETNYILGNDLVLENYKPIDVNVASFDGNGRKIIIRSFADFDSASIDVGLFAHIYPNMVVMNVVVVYDMFSGQNASTPPLGFIDTDSNNNRYYDLCTVENVNYQQVRFGGLAAQNEGVVYNCQVKGAVAFKASALENNVASSGNEINFFMAGMVCTNTETGKITNSDSYLAMAGLVNISGFVYNNYGKVASSSFIAGNGETSATFFNSTIGYSQQNQGYNEININSAGYIFGKNEDISSTIDTMVTGFVNSNSGEISMSYVEIKGNNFTAKDRASGFVYTNSGSIYDCYVNQEYFGDVGNGYCGFVQINQGSISTCYTYINGGTWNGDSRNMFAPTRTENISDCYEIVKVIASYIQQKYIDGVTQIYPDARTSINSYAAFAFGNNNSAVWKISDGRSMPNLVATQQKVEYTGKQPSTDEHYYGLRQVNRLPEDEDGVISFEINDDSYGVKENPYAIYNLQTWNYYFATAKNSSGELKGSNYYYRLINDIDFYSVDSKPTTSTNGYTFNGNLQGNNLEIQNIILYSDVNEGSMGLFANVTQSGVIGGSVDNTIANLKLSVSSIMATKTQAVGALAGTIENYKIYNIVVDSANKVVVGGNAVGGVAGIIQGDFDVAKISSNIGVNSTVGFSERLSIYTGNNLQNVYYAGSIFGIAYGEGSQIKNITVNGNIVSIGHIVGSALGYVGKGVQVSNAKATLQNSNLKGKYYSGGIIGENHGTVLNCNISVDGEDVLAFSGERSVFAGLVGLNANGFISNCSASIDVEILDQSSTVGGLVGRSVNGYIADSTYSGKLKGYFTGGIIGSILSKDIFENSLSNDISRVSLATAYGSQQIKNVSVSLDTVNYWLDNLSYFYTYSAGEANLFNAINHKRVLGFGVGTSQNADIAEADVNLNYGYNAKEKLFVFNGETEKIDKVGMIENLTLQDGVIYSTPMLNVISTLPVNTTHICFVVGAKLSGLDSWDKRNYSNETVMLTKSSINELKMTKMVEELVQDVGFYIYPKMDSSNSYQIRVINGSAEDEYTISWRFNYLTDFLGDEIVVKKGEEGSEEEIEISGKQLSETFTNSLRITFTNGQEGDEEKKVVYSFKII